ncbi:MAG TPA: DNA (cytosine-5-)-methyltransferase [Candidatus Moranbacteria bacterium]|nr:DNA (cytosine-5-)-methyltransferase [Candidatus Moranbacteria bacterium]HAT75203.1 DNA (cytosine-5-)-methyltransferase [Candidatus Moranbacteria bacterium]
MNKNKKLKVIDLFSGVGGLSYGFAHNDNFEIAVANEILPSMAKAYSLNHPTVKVYVEDVKDFNAKKIEKDLNIKASEVDIIIGGPPCQAYSTVGKRLIDDPRGKLFQEYYRVLKEFDPRLFLFENVRGLLSMQNGELLKTIISCFESLGYKVQCKLLNAADYGAPQIRERVVIIGSKLKTDFQYPEPTHRNPKEKPDLFNRNFKSYLTLEEAISDLPFIKSNSERFEYASEPQNIFQTIMRKKAPVKLMDHNSPNNNEKLVKIMELLPDGGTPNDLPESLRPISGFKNTYCRLWWKRPAPTITRNLSTPSSSRCIHPKAPRPLTTREGARIQCFPDNYQFYGSRSDKNLQVGNAVPTFLSIALAESILNNFRKSELA